MANQIITTRWAVKERAENGCIEGRPCLVGFPIVPMHWDCAVGIGVWEQPEKRNQAHLAPDFHFACQKVFYICDPNFLPVKDAGGQGRFGFGFSKDLVKVFLAAGTA